MSKVYTVSDFNNVWGKTVASSEETKKHLDIYRFFKDHPEFLVGNPVFAGCTADDIKIELEYVIDGCDFIKII